jgi:RHS repeat-associated protein
MVQTAIYTYNQLNNLLEVKKNNQTDSTYQYDARGNQTQEIAKKEIDGVMQDVTTNYTYDPANRLDTVTISAPGTATHTIRHYYNGNGQRIKQDDNGLITKYYYSLDDLLYTTDQNNVKAEEHILDPAGTIVASKRFDGNYADKYFFYNYDIRGSVTSIIKPDGSRVKGYDYDEFGNVKEVGESQFKNDVKFTGAVHDKSTGLYYMNARFYNPSNARFLTQDTYSGNPYEPWTQHLYAYCGNNPVNMVDPTGHLAIKVSNKSIWNH